MILADSKNIPQEPKVDTSLSIETKNDSFQVQSSLSIETNVIYVNLSLFFYNNINK